MSANLAYCVFDFLHLDGDVMERAFLKRKVQVEALLKRLPAG